MENELIFQYPIQDDEGQGVNAEIERLMKIRSRMIAKTRAIFLAISFIICFLYVISDLSNALPLIIISLFVALFFIGYSVSGGISNVDFYTEITAYETYIDIKQTRLSNGITEQATIFFEDIEWAIMSRSLERIQICFAQNNSEMYYYSFKDNSFERVTGGLCLIDIPLNSYTYQQYYFLYLAGDYFNIRIPKTLNNEKIILKKYGYSDDYLEQLK